MNIKNKPTTFHNIKWREFLFSCWKRLLFLSAVGFLLGIIIVYINPNIGPTLYLILLLYFILLTGITVNYQRFMRYKGLLHQAAETGNLQEVRKMLSAGASVDTREFDGATPLHCAVVGAHDKRMDIILSRGSVFIDPKHEKKYLRIHAKPSKPNLEVIRYLISKGANLNATDNFGGTPLHWALRNGTIEAVKVLLESGSDITILDRKGATVLHYAAMRGDTKIAKLLLDFGADDDMNDVCVEGDTPLQWAQLVEGNEEMIDFLMANRPKISR